MTAMNLNVVLQPAFVLHQRPYRESSLLLEVFGVESGRVGLIAKGARRPKSPHRALLCPFRALLLSWRGRGELGVVVGVEPGGAALVMPPACLVSGLYANELLVRLLHRHDPHPELFLQYGLTVHALADANCSVEQILRVFEKRLLEAIGYGLTLDRVADSGSPIDPNQTYGYIPDYGPVESDSRSDGIPVQGSTLLALASEQLGTSQALREAKLLMRSVINVHLEGRAVVSREMFPRPFSPARRFSA